jgi:anti-sigma B factor antagonist
MIPFTIKVDEPRKGVGVASLSGRLNALSAPAAKERLKALAQETSGRLVLDLGDLAFLDSSGLAALVSGYKAAIEVGGSLKLASLVPQVAQIFALTRLDRVFEIYPDVETAVSSFLSGA